MKNIGLLLFIILFLGGLLSYVIVRGYQSLSEFRVIKLTYAISFVAFFALLITTLMYADTLHNKFANILYFVSYTFFILLAYLFLLFIIVDIFRIVNHMFIHIPKESMLVIRLWSMIIGLIIITTTLIIGNYRFNHPQVVRLEIKSSKPLQNKRLKIVAASDIHLGHYINKNKFDKYVSLINAQEPDIVLLAGDIFDRNLQPVLDQGMDEEFLKIESKHGVYAISGNHDYYGGNKHRNFDFLTKSKVKILLDSTSLIDNSLYIIGREDRTNTRRKPLNEIINGINPNLPSILLDHQPYMLEEAEKHNIDLQISGHTHNGQFFPINIIEKKMYELSYGFKKKGNTSYYVSSGLGIWGPEYRIGTQSEIVVIEFTY